jgi:hypothetical protein
VKSLNFKRIIQDFRSLENHLTNQVSSLIVILAVFFLGSSCRLGQSLRQTQVIPSPIVPVTVTGPETEDTGGFGNPAQLSPSASPAPGSTLIPPLPREQPVIEIPLSGPASQVEAELSGLAWFGDWLVMLPQYPQRMSPRGQPGVLFGLPGKAIRAYLEGASQEPLIPTEIGLTSPDLEALIPDYEGFEALAFIGDRVFLTIESGELGPMMSYLIAGTVSSDFAEIRLDAETLLRIPPQADLINRGEEALLVCGDRLLSLFETNGSLIVSHPVARSFDPETLTVRTIPFPNIEYRITDATPADDSGRFWALNTFYPGDLFIFPQSDPIADQYGEGATHARELAVERLVKLQVGTESVALVETPPIQLELLDSFQGRNWEGLAELPGKGFLLVTDRNPETILAFVPYP